MTLRRAFSAHAWIWTVATAVLFFGAACREGAQPIAGADAGAPFDPGSSLRASYEVVHAPKGAPGPNEFITRGDGSSFARAEGAVDQIGLVKEAPGATIVAR